MAQKSSELGLFLGVSTYQGDLVQDPFDAGESNFALGINFRQMFSPKWALKIGLNYGKISGSDVNVESREERGVTMNTDLFELGAQLEWHFLGEERFPSSGQFNRTFSPYIGAGLGMVFASQTLEFSSTRNFTPEKDTGSFVILPIDAGLRLNLSPTLTSTLSIGSRATFSDLLDGVSANGNSDADDWYLLGGLSFLYTFR